MPLPTDCDLLVVGGGINGAGIARDAAGRGLRVLLAEQHDLAAHTSSASTKLIHGGLRYLEHRHFSLVRKALQEREVLLGIAPHIARPLRFVMPHAPHLRPAWLIRCGLFLYDHLARRRTLPASITLDLRQHPAGQPLAATYRRGFAYYDAWVDDARLVVLNALSAHERGADICSQTKVTQLVAEGDRWLATLIDRDGGRQDVRARAVVNATGPWAASFLQQALPQGSSQDLRLVKGSHIIVPRIFDHDDAYIFQAADRRIVFAIPYEGRFTLIGTTDIDYAGPLDRVSISSDETTYLCDEANRYFKQRITPADVVASFAGVRPLLADEATNASGATRDFQLELHTDPLPLLSVFGGKITTYRVLAEQAVDLLQDALGRRHPVWTQREPLPGGDLPAGGLPALHTTWRRQCPWLPEELLHRWLRSYGTRIARLLGSAVQMSDLGREIVPGLHELEVKYLLHHEFAVTAEDILWRRSKLGLHLSGDAATHLQRWLDDLREEAA
jgi:glycerol-3-phosphate dehydrogenase